ncbi:hypothetical protein SLS60_008803 [Paraconiothyrium brasiliense]|uniref:DNA (cytosine-5-)-methyltransferase n=1 Tax=Paraconiothyrium brasiliense TaxID=300254 RepID=A0ABR3QYI5_9PLEO
MDGVDRQLSTDTIAALNVPFGHDANHRNKATTARGETVKPNDSVELRDGSFLRIVFITKDLSGKRWLHGIRLRHNEEVDKKWSEKLGHHLKALLPCDENEVCAIIKTTTDSDAIDAFLVSEPLIDVVRKRQIVFTNTVRTWGNSQVAANIPTRDFDRHVTLFCRFKYIEKADLKKRSVAEFKLQEDDLPTHMLQHTRKPDAVHTDPRQPLKACITTRGGDTDVHPYEKRSFNMAELAVLNGFPAWHQFPPKLGITALRELIGNAVPALSFKLFFDKVVEALKETDEDLEQYEKNEGRDFME